MSEFEQELKRELRRVPAPEQFADRVMKRAARKRRARGWLAATVLLGVLAGAAAVEEQHYESRQAALARQQFELAMQVTSRTLAEVERQIGRAGARSSEVEQ